MFRKQTIIIDSALRRMLGEKPMARRAPGLQECFRLANVFTRCGMMRQPPADADGRTIQWFIESGPKFDGFLAHFEKASRIEVVISLQYDTMLEFLLDLYSNDEVNGKISTYQAKAFISWENGSAQQPSARISTI